MRILFANWALDTRSGTESYLETVVPQLATLGHEVFAWAFDLGATAERLSDVGATVVEDLEGLDGVDVVHAQQASAALAVRARFPEVPLVYACHSWALELDEPPPAAAPAALLAFNDRVLDRLHASALAPDTPIHRLRQPVAISAMENERRPIRNHLGAVLALSRKLRERSALLEEACARIGAHLERASDWSDDEDATRRIMRSDVVFASGRTALEAMALGRATFVFDYIGGVGFVTAETYPAIEASGFDVSTGRPMTVDALVAELGRYDPELGILGRELAARHHAAQTHATELVEIYRSVLGAPAGPRQDPDALFELAVMTQRVFQLEQRLRQTQWDHAELSRNVTDVQRELDRLRASTSWKITRPLRLVRRRPDDHD